VRRAVTVLLSLALIGGSAGAAAATDASAPPSHDTIEGATVVTDLPFTDTVDISTATVGPEDEVGGCFFGASTTVWYRYTPAADVRVELTTAGSDFNTTLEVFTGDRTLVDCDYADAGLGTSRLLLSLTAGQEYLIRAADYYEDTGTLVLSMSELAPPSHDTIEGATVVTDLPFTDTVDISGATAGPEDEVGGCFGGASTTVWYRYSPVEDVVVDLATAGSNFDTTLEVFSRPGMSRVACNDDSGGSATSRLRTSLEGGQDYLIRAAGYFASTGTLVLSMSEFVPIEVTVAIGDTGRLTFGGRAVIDVTVACNRPADVDLFLDGRQALGPTALRGTAGRVVRCRRETTQSVRLDPGTGAFLPGLLDVGYTVTACEPGTFFFEGCVNVEGTETVLLVPGP
jgi:hypothetical protein